MRFLLVRRYRNDQRDHIERSMGRALHGELSKPFSKRKCLLDAKAKQSAAAAPAVGAPAGTRQN